MLYTSVARDRSVYVVPYSLNTEITFDTHNILQFDTVNFDEFYVASTNTVRGDINADTDFNRNTIRKYTKSTDTWITLLDIDTGQPQFAHPFDFLDHIENYVDNRKSLRVIEHNNEKLIFYRKATDSQASISFLNETDDTITDVRSESLSAEENGVAYSMDFALDERSDGIHVYSFVVRYSLTEATLKVFRERVEPSGSETEIFTETFSRSGTVEFPISVSSVILADDRSKFYFALDYSHEDEEIVGKAELCSLPKAGGTRTVIKEYSDSLLGPRSPVEMDSKYFCLEGGWARLPRSNTDSPRDEKHFPNYGGNLVEISSADEIVEHGIIWRSATKKDSPDPDGEMPYYDGWGLHNAIVSNMVKDSNSNLHFIAGYGLSLRIVQNVSVTPRYEPIPDISNFVWIQYGNDLATKIPSFPTQGSNTWELIQQLGLVMLWEVGFIPNPTKLNQAISDFSFTEFQAGASLFFRPKTILPGSLENAISSSGSSFNITTSNLGTDTERTEFPDPPSGEKNYVLIDQEVFGYTSVSESGDQIVLSGITRAEMKSTASSHPAESGVYFIDFFCSGEFGTTLESIENRELDFINLFNKIEVGFGGEIHTEIDQNSIDENRGEFTFPVRAGDLLTDREQVWASLLAKSYLGELKDLKELITCILVFSPQLNPGQLMVVYQEDILGIGFKPFRILNVSHAVPSYKTQVLAREI